MKEILITSTVLIAVILLLRLILGKRVSRGLIYATWLLVALRLLIPFQFGQAQFSMISMAEKLEQQSPLLQQAQEEFQQPVAGPDEEERYAELMQSYLSQPDSPSTVPPEVQTQLRQEAQASTVTPGRILTILWVGGAVLFAGWFLITNLLFLHKAKRGAILFSDCCSPVPVRISPYVSTPCLAGLFRPRIYLTPESTADPQTLNHVLTHELTHLKHLDHIWAWVRCLCLCIYWFDPLVWLAAIVSKRDCELACDEAALKKLGEDQRLSYGRTLLATVTHTSVRVFQTTTAMSESGKQLKERVNFIVKKPKRLLIAAVCLVLATVLTTTLVFTGCKPQADPIPPTSSQETTPPETTEPTTTQPTTTQPATEPDVLFEAGPDILSIVPPLQADIPQAQWIARDAINRYLWYGLDRVCCDHELVVADLSRYLTDAQKEEYHQQQYKITCCENAKQVRDHINRCLSKDHQRYGYPDDRLFTDGDGNLYVMINPTCYNGYGHIELISRTNSKIVARACSIDEDGCFRNTVFTLRATGKDYQVTKVEEDKDYRCEAVIVDQGPNYKVLQYGSSYGYEFYDDDGSLGSHNRVGEFRCPTITPISDRIMELAISYGPGHVSRTYYDVRSHSHSKYYDYAIAVGYGKIAYLEGDLDNRVLVVCDIFDPGNADEREYLGFAPEPMPVSEAFFTEAEYGYELTLTYRIGKVTEVTETLSVSP